MSKFTVYPILCYHDAEKAIDWLTRTIDFTLTSRHDRPDGSVAHAELTYGPGMVMVRQAADSDVGEGGPMAAPPGGSEVYVAVEDADAHHKHAKENNAEIIFEPTDMFYGSREYGLRDPEGNIWTFGTYNPSDNLG